MILLHAPDIDLDSTAQCSAIVEYLVRPTPAFTTVKDHQVPRLRITPIHVFCGLIQTIGDGLLQALVEYFTLDHDFARLIALRPDDQ